MPNNYLTILLLTLIFFAVSTDQSHADDVTPLDLIHAQGCKGCHVLNDSGGVLGPALNDVGSRLTREQILQKLLKHKQTDPSSSMPDFRHMTEQELSQMADYLSRQH